LGVVTTVEILGLIFWELLVLNFSGLGLLFFPRFNCLNFCVNFLETFGFEFFRFGETRLGGKDLRWFVKGN